MSASIFRFGCFNALQIALRMLQSFHFVIRFLDCFLLNSCQRPIFTSKIYQHDNEEVCMYIRCMKFRFYHLPHHLLGFHISFNIEYLDLGFLTFPVFGSVSSSLLTRRVRNLTWCRWHKADVLRNVHVGTFRSQSLSAYLSVYIW